MTAAIVYVQPEAVHLLTDGALMANGRTAAIKQKVQIAAHQSAAYVARGPDMFGGLLAVIVGQAQGDFDQLAANFASMCASAHAAMLEAISNGTPVSCDPSMVDAVLVGRSPTKGFCAFTVCSYPEDDRPAWALRPIGGDAALAFVSPLDDVVTTNLKLQQIDLWDAAPNIEKHGLAIMREQRGTGIVGGFCQITSVLHGGVFTRVLEHWPNAAGQLAA